MAVSNGGMNLHQDMDTDTNWTGEDGISLEEFQQGTASQQWIVAKNGNETATLAKAQDMSGAKYLTIPMISTISPFYTSISALLSDGTNTENFTLADQLGSTLHRKVQGQWQFNTHCLEFGENGGTLTLSAFASIAFNVDNSSSGNIRSVLNHYIDAIYFGTGRTISGTTATDLLFTESNDLDISSDVFDGCSLVFEGVVFFQTDVLITTTTGNSFAEKIVFRSVENTSRTYVLAVTGTADFQGTTIDASDSLVTVNLDVSAATAFAMAGGSLSAAGTTAFKSGQSIKGVIFTDRTSLTHNGSTFEGNVINTSGPDTVIGTGTHIGNTYDKPTGVSGVITADLDFLDEDIFISDGSTHAVELTSIGDGSMGWNCTTTSFDAGSAASPVTPTATGNEDIYVNVASGTLTISVATGATIPSIRSAGATVNVVAGQVTLLIVVKDEADNALLQDSAVTVKADSIGNLPFNDSVTITSTGGTATVSHTSHGLTTGQKVAISGANENEYNRIKTVTVTGANSYTYTIVGTPASPATGTITSTAVIIDGVTDVNGEISDTRSYSVNQSFTGLIQKGTGTNIYKARPTSGTIDSGSGASQTILLTKD